MTQRTNHHPYLVINDPPPAPAEPTTVAFISVAQDVTKLSPGVAPVGFALVEVTGIVYDQLFVWDIKPLPADQKAVIDFLLEVNRIKPYQRLCIDLENFGWLNGRAEWNNALRLAIEQSPRRTFPSLRPLGEVMGAPERGKEPMMRQMSALQGPLARGEFQLAASIQKNTALKAEASRYGQSMVCDALAGAIYVAKKMQLNLQRSINLKV